MSQFPTPRWDPSFADRSPAFEPLRRAMTGLGDERFPSIADLQRLVDGAETDVLAGQQHRLRPVPADPASPERYEQRIFRTGELPVRTNSWHDLFNVLVWLTFPRAKAALNTLHVREMELEPPGWRGSVRDALAQFDEDGMVVLCSEPELLQLIRTFQWKELFWGRREDVMRHVRFLIFGHALYEKLLSPFLGITGKAVMIEIPSPLTALQLQDQLSTADRLVVRMADAGAFDQPLNLQPLPVLGIPGWTAASAEEAFYADVSYFRPGRRIRTSSVKAKRTIFG